MSGRYVARPDFVRVLENILVAPYRPLLRASECRYHRRLFFASPSFWRASALAGDVVYPVVVGVIVQWTVGVGVACLLGLPLRLGLVGVWIGFLLDENLRGVILTRRWHSLKWFGKSFT